MNREDEYFFSDENYLCNLGRVRKSEKKQAAVLEQKIMRALEAIFKQCIRLKFIQMTSEFLLSSQIPRSVTVRAASFNCFLQYKVNDFLLYSLY